MEAYLKQPEEAPKPGFTLWSPTNREWLRNTKENRKIATDSIANVMRYILHHKLGDRTVGYYLARDGRVDGRVYAKLGIQNIDEGVRDAGLDPRYRDIDIDASHQTCLRLLFQLRELPVPEILEDYLDNKEAIRQMLAEYYGCTLVAAKARINEETIACLGLPRGLNVTA